MGSIQQARQAIRSEGMFQAVAALRAEIITTLAASEGAIGGTGWVFSNPRKAVSGNCLTKPFLRGDWDGPYAGQTPFGVR